MSAITDSSPAGGYLSPANSDKVKIFMQASAAVSSITCAIISYIATSTLFPSLAKNLGKICCSLSTVALTVIGVGGAILTALFILGLINLTKSREAAAHSRAKAGLL